MLRFAIIQGERRPPFPRGRGTCPACGGNVIARCGPRAPSGARRGRRSDCDPWSEGIGPWHLSWQELVRPEFVEVPIGPHRADILGANGAVIELQHSPISPREIAERERFYGNMTWVFDAVGRFGGLRSGDRFFFSFGRTRHLTACARPVVLDFGEFLVQAETLTDVISGFSGFGLVRDREWFVRTYLGDRTAPGPLPSFVRSEDRAEPWPGRPPWKLTAFPSHWCENGRLFVVPKLSPFIPLDGYHQDAGGDSHRPAWTRVVAAMPMLADGWSEADLWELKSVLNARPMILEGRLRLMPSRAEEMKAAMPADVLRGLLDKLDVHIEEGRIPILKDETRRLLLRKAEDYERRP